MELREDREEVGRGRSHTKTLTVLSRMAPGQKALDVLSSRQLDMKD